MRVQQRGDKPWIVGRGQRQHGKTMLEIRQPALLLVRRNIGRSKVDPAQLELLRRRARHRQMPEMDGIERSAE